MDANTNGPVAPPTRRWWPRALLIASLALNLMFVGLAVGAVLRFGGHDRERPPPSVAGALYRAMPSADRAEMRAEMRAMRESARAETYTAEAEAIAAALRATPFDAEALEALVEAQMARQTSWFTGAQAAWLARVKAMSADARADYARRLIEAVEHKPRRKGWFGG